MPLPDFPENAEDEMRSPKKLVAEARRRSKKETVEAMIVRYDHYGRPIGKEGYIVG